MQSATSADIDALLSPTRPILSIAGGASASSHTSPVFQPARLSISTAVTPDASTPNHRPSDASPSPQSPTLLLPAPLITTTPTSSAQPFLSTPTPGAGGQSPRARTASPNLAEDAVNWQRRMQKVETSSTRRTSFLQRQNSGIAQPNSPLQRAQSFSTAIAAASSAALLALNGGSATPTNNLGSYASSPHLKAGGGGGGSTSTGAKKSKPHHRSMSNVVDWTPYSKRKQRPTSIPPFSPSSNKPLPAQQSPPPNLVHSASPPPLPRPIASPRPPSPYTRYLGHLHRLRLTRPALSFRHFTHTTAYFSLCVLLTLFSLYAQDVNECWLPPSADLPISVLLTITLSLFSLDILLNSAVRPGYFLSFFFFLDVIGTLSLMLDIQFMLPLGLDSVQSSAPSQHLNQSGNALRVTRFVRLFRIMQVIRVVKLFKFHAEVEGRVGKGVETANRVGLQLSELIDIRVISMLLGLIIILPFFTVDDSDYGLSEQMGLNVLEALILPAGIPATTLNDTASFLSTYQLYHPSLLYLSFPTSPPYTPVSLSQSGLRSQDVESYSAPNGSVAVFDISGQYYTASLYSLILTSIIIAMFMAGSVLVSKDVYFLVVAPLERMTSIIKKLAGTICFLTHDEEDAAAASPHDGSGASITESVNETRVIEGIIEKLATIFQVQPDTSMAGPKALQRMAGSKHTEITTTTSVVSIAVVERPRLDVEEVAEDVGGKVEKEVDTSKYRELNTVEDGMAHAGVLPHFRLYLTANLLMENLLFFQEVERYKAILCSHAHSLYANFVSASSSSQVNISASLHDRIKEQVAAPRATMFDEAQSECVMLMKAHVRGFAESKYAQLYLRKKARQAGSAEVMYKKKRGGGGIRTSEGERAVGGPSQRNSVVLGRGKIIAEEEEEEEESQKGPVLAVPAGMTSRLSIKGTVIRSLAAKADAHLVDHDVSVSERQGGDAEVARAADQKDEREDDSVQSKVEGVEKEVMTMPAEDGADTRAKGAEAVHVDADVEEEVARLLVDDGLLRSSSHSGGGN